MSRIRVPLLIALSVISCTWSVRALVGYAVHLNQREVVAAIRSSEVLPEDALIARAMAMDEAVLPAIGCNATVYEDMAVLAAQGVDRSLLASDDADADAPLKNMQDVLATRLSCTPLDGKAWLDVAIVTTYREGITAHALEAYRMSQRVAPGESWLAQKRLLFALRFRPLMNADARSIAIQDLHVLEHAHPNRMTAVEHAAKVDSSQALYALFAEGV